MIFESINYGFALQDFIFSLAAGFAVGFFNQVLSVFLYDGKIRIFIRDMTICFVFAVTVFSYVISFTNYPIIRIYHILGGLLGFLCFPFKFSIYFQKFFKKFFSAIKNNILCLAKKISTTICGKAEKIRKKRSKPRSEPKNDHLQQEEVLVYNL